MPATFPVFIVTVVSLIIVPGPDMLYVTARSVLHGRRFAFYAAAGIASGYAVFSVLLALGIKVLLDAHPAILQTMQVVGLCYLSYVAYALLTDDGRLDPPEEEGDPTPQIGKLTAKTSLTMACFGNGVLTSLFNPKGILFYFSVLPQFIDPAADPFWQAALLYGFTTAFLCLLIYLGAGIGAIYWTHAWLVNAARRRLVSRISGLILTAVIIGIAMSL